jgi:hypothetical protein
MIKILYFSYYMDFAKDSQINTMKLHCNIVNSLRSLRILYGSGGSRNIIIIAEDNKRLIVLKIIPQFNKDFNVNVASNADQLEIKFYELFTKDLLMKNRTPHIVGIYNKIRCNNFNDLFKNKCPPEEKILTTKIDQTIKPICNLKIEKKYNMVKSTYDIVQLEYAPLNITTFIEENKLIKKKEIFDFIDRVVFQIMYTMAGMHKIYKNYVHSDLFLRNVLGVELGIYADNTFVEYKIFNKSYYLPANGYYTKITDFGGSAIASKLENNMTGFIKSSAGQRFHLSLYNKKTDIFNFLHDLHDGQNLGAKSIMALCQEHHVKKSVITKIRKSFNKYINTKIIDKINKVNRYDLNITWYINNIKILENTVHEPHQYFKLGVFKKFEVLPKNGKIIYQYSFDS